MRQADPDYLKMIRALPCIVCGKGEPNEAAHVRYSDEASGKPITGIGIRPDDKWALPLCHNHHIHGQHMSGERQWWQEQAIDPINLCQSLYKCWEDGKKSRLSWPRQRDAMILIIGLGWVHG